MAVKSGVSDVKSSGGDMSLFTYQPDGAGKRPAVIVIQEIFGVNNNVKGIAKRYAEEGYFAVAPDMFHRQGRHLDVPYPEMERAVSLRGTMSNDDILADVNATVAFLRSNPAVNADRIGIVGFCFGGMVSYFAAAKVDGIKAAAIYYGGGILPRDGSPEGTPRLLDATVADVKAPLIAFWGGKDQNPSPAQSHEITDALKAHGKQIDATWYDDAGHGFMCDGRASWNEPACLDSWSKVLPFFAKHLGK
ncbi:MAG: dienelactone hydrolase family protein [Chloroflexota bacterium]